MAKLDPELLTLLRSVDTPTVCNAIEVAQGKRGFSKFTRGTMICSDPEGGSIVGFAKTAKRGAVVKGGASRRKTRKKKGARGPLPFA